MKERLGRWLRIAAMVAIGLFTVVLVGRNVVHAVRIERQIAKLEREREHYRAKITADSTLIEQLQYDDYLEAYAREHFRMQRRDEHVYLMEDE